MKLKNITKKITVYLLGAGLVLMAGGLLYHPAAVYAESGAVYSCTINRSYSHPVTGEVEDSGGESSMATGQGMVEGCVYGSGLMEVTDSGNYYLTVRLGLMDYTSNQSFAVQNVGDSGWMSTGTVITGNGSDNNGTTADLCIQVPSENCIVRGSMYVTPMGRDVIFYFYPSNYSEGNSVGMNPAFVTETGGTAESTDNGTETMGTVNETADDTQQDSTMTEDTESQSEETAEATDTDSAGEGLQATSIPKEQETESDQELNSAQGLSLSTAEEQTEDETDQNSTGQGTVNSIVILTSSITIAGLILITVAAFIVWFFRKNWRRWGGEDDDDEY